MTDAEKRLRELAQAATAGPWRWWTSCSFRRLSSDATGKDGDVLHAVVHRDGVADIQGSEADRAFIESANPATVIALLDRIASLEADNAAMAEELKQQAEELEKWVTP